MPEANDVETPKLDPELRAALDQVLQRMDEVEVEIKSAAKNAAPVDDVQKLQNELGELRDTLASYEKKLPNFSVPGANSNPGEGDEWFSYGRAIHAIGTGDWRNAGYEREVFETTRAKAMSFGTGSAGGFIVPDDQSREIIDRLKAQSVAFQLGAREVPLTVSPFKYPRKTGSATTYWVGEGATITASDLTLDQLSLEHKKIAMLTVFSSELLQLSDPNVEGVIRDDFADELALGLDNGIINGSGAGGQPTGIVNTGSVGTSALSDPPTYDELQDIVASVRNSNALAGNLGWAMSPQQFVAIEKMTDAASQPLNRRVVADGPADTLLGYRYRTTTQMAATAGAANALVFGNWADCLVGRWGGLRLFSSEHAAMETDEVKIRATMLVDVALRHPESFCANT